MVKWNAVEETSKAPFPYWSVMTCTCQLLKDSMWWLLWWTAVFMCWVSCWAGSMGGACLHLGQRWLPVTPCSSTWQQRQRCMAEQCTSFLCHWICNCCKCCCRKQVGGTRLLSAERLPLLAGLVDAQWFTVFGSAGSFLTLTNACVMEAGPYSYCSTLQVLLPRGDPNALKKQQHVRN